MTNPRDPIDDWLSSDVELMPPPPGAFERVHRRARRRKTVRAVSTVAGAAVVIAAAATLPQVASSLLPGHNNSGQAKVSVGSTSPRHASTPAIGVTATPTMQMIIQTSRRRRVRCLACKL